jgi:hypothetical protein
MTPALRDQVTDQLRKVPRLTFQQIADKEGLSVGTISALAKAAGLTRGKGGAGTHARPRGRPSEFGEQVVALRLSGSSVAEIMAETGLTRQGVDAICVRFLTQVLLALAQDLGLPVTMGKSRVTAVGKIPIAYQVSTLSILCPDPVPITDDQGLRRALKGARP